MAKGKGPSFPGRLTKREGNLPTGHPLLAITDNRKLPIKIEFPSTTKQTPTE